MFHNDNMSDASKVPAITIGFWIAKIIATTLGETGGDAVTMSWLGETTANASSSVSGYLIGTAIFGGLLAVLVALQVRAKGYHPALYWATIVASTTAGTTLADYATRSIGLGYLGGTLLLAALVALSLGSWKAIEGKISASHVVSGRAELFYWLTITFSQTLGTALGDWAADDGGLGYLGGAALFGGLIAVVAGLYLKTSVNRVALFWAAFVLSRPLGATLGDFLDKPLSQGGLALSRTLATIVLVLALVVSVAAFVKPERSRAGPTDPSDQ